MYNIMEYLDHKTIEKARESQTIKFEEEDYDDYTDRVTSAGFTSHHEPRLTEEAHVLVNEAVGIPQNDILVLDERSDKKYAKTVVGPCILMVAHDSKKKRLGAIHFDVGSDIELLIDDLKRELGIENFNDYDISLVGGIKSDDDGEMKVSEDFRNKLMDYLNDQKVKIIYDGTLKLAESDYKYHAKEWVHLFYEPLIVDRSSGLVLSYDAWSDLVGGAADMWEEEEEYLSGPSTKTREDAWRAIQGQVKKRTLYDYCQRFDLKPEYFEGKSILDVGAGAAIFAKDSKNKGVSAIGFDPIYLFKRGRRIFREVGTKKELPQGMAGLSHDLPFKDEKFDILTFVYSAFLYADDFESVRKTLEEGLRVLKNDGSLYIYPFWQEIGKDDGSFRICEAIEDLLKKLDVPYEIKKPNTPAKDEELFSYLVARKK